MFYPISNSTRKTRRQRTVHYWNDIVSTYAMTIFIYSTHSLSHPYKPYLIGNSMTLIQSRDPRPIHSCHNLHNLPALFLMIYPSITCITFSTFKEEFCSIIWWLNSNSIQFHDTETNATDLLKALPLFSIFRYAWICLDL